MRVPELPEQCQSSRSALAVRFSEPQTEKLASSMLTTSMHTAQGWQICILSYLTSFWQTTPLGFNSGPAFRTAISSEVRVSVVYLDKGSRRLIKAVCLFARALNP